MNFLDCPETVPKLIAVLRGITPEQAEKTGAVLYENGIGIMEVTLNSPDPYRSISILKKSLPKEVRLGAGTVVVKDQVQRVKDAGGELIISPHTDEEIIKEAKAKKMYCVPGVFSPTEIIKAIQAGADALKFFPAGVLGITGFKVVSAVIPKDIPLVAVGGVNTENMAEYYQAGYMGFGMGNSLFKPGDSPEETAVKAQKLVGAYNKIFSA